MKDYDIYYPEYNVENIIDFLDLKRKKMINSKKKINNVLNPTEILKNYNCLSPIQKHQKKRISIINSEMYTLNFKRTSTLKKTHSFLAAN